VVARYRDGLARQARFVTFAGDVTRAEAEALVQEHLDGPEATLAARPTPPEPGVRAGRHLCIVDKPERTQTQIQIGSLGTHPHDTDHTALLVGNAVFGGAFTARLMRAVRSERGWSYGASSRLAIDRVREAFSMWTFPAAKDAAACIALELALLGEWIEGGIREEELAFAKSYLIKSYAFSVDTADKRADQAMDVWLYDLPADYFSGYTSRIAEVTIEQVNRALRRRLSTQDLVITVLATDADIGGELRALPDLASVESVRFDSDAV
jgi:zinc protease